MIRVVRETKEAPREIQERIARAGGRNLYGHPNFRVIWGQSRLTWMGGNWQDRDTSGNLVRQVLEVRRVPKYAVDRWIVERWLPPECSPEQWGARMVETDAGRRISAHGPYPATGDYEHCFTVQGPQGEFVQLTPSIVDGIVRIINAGRERFSAAERKAALKRREERRERNWHAYAESVLWGEQKAFGGQPFVSVI